MQPKGQTCLTPQNIHHYITALIILSQNLSVISWHLIRLHKYRNSASVLFVFTTIHIFSITACHCIPSSDISFCVNSSSFHLALHFSALLQKTFIFHLTNAILSFDCFLEIKTSPLRLKSVYLDGNGTSFYKVWLSNGTMIDTFKLVLSDSVKISLDLHVLNTLLFSVYRFLF